MRLAALLACLAGPALAGPADVVDGHLMPGLARLEAAGAALATAASADCAAASLRPAVDAVFDAWMPVADLRLGPSEAAGLTIFFWPDERSAGQRALAGLIVAEDPAALTPDGFAAGSAAIRGLAGLDLMLAEPPSPYLCALIRTASQDLSAQTTALREAWESAAEDLRHPGAPGNLTYLDETEASGAIYTQILAGLDVTFDSRIGRPLGTFDHPRPTRAEASRSGRPLANIRAAAGAARDMARLLAGRDLPATEAALAAVNAAADAITDPTFADIEDPQAWLRLEILGQRVSTLKDAIEAELGGGLGLTAGFNAADGD